jgi:hypothetical protein
MNKQNGIIIEEVEQIQDTTGNCVFDGIQPTVCTACGSCKESD